MFVGSALYGLTLVFETDLLITTEFTSATLNFDTFRVSVIGFSITCLRFLEVWAGFWVTRVTVLFFFTLYWLTCIGTFLDTVSIVSIRNGHTVRETFVWGIVTIAMIMGVTLLFNTFVIMAIVFVWTVFRLDTLLWFTDVLLAETFTIFAVLVRMEFASSMRSTINFFTDVLSWIFLVNLFTKMIFTAIGIVFALDWFTCIVDTSCGVSTVLMSLAIDWVTGVLQAFVLFIFVVTEMWPFSSEFWKVVTVESVFTFDLDTSFVFTFHTGSTMFTSVTCSFVFLSVFVENLNDAFVVETETTMFVGWIGTIFV